MTWRSPARGRVDSLIDWINATRDGSYQVMAPPEILNRPPIPPTSTPLENLHRVAQVVAPAAHVARIPNGLAIGTEGAVVTRDGCLVVDLTRAWGRPLEDHPIWDSGAMPVRRVEGTAAVVATRGAATNFSHLLADTAPRIQLVRDAGIDIDAWIVSDNRTNWQRETLHLAGIDLSQTISLADTPAVEAADLVVPSRTGFAPATAPWARRALRTLLPTVDGPHSRRIYISRARAGRRRLINEAQVVELLERRGFEIAHFDNLPLSEQIRTVQQADIILALHGAALSHLLHAPPEGTVLEIADPRIVRPEYWGLAGLADWEYHLVPAVTAGPPCQAILMDHEVSIQELERTLDVIQE